MVKISLWVKPEVKLDKSSPEYDLTYKHAAELMGYLEPIVWRGIKQVTIACYDDPALGPIILTPNGAEWNIPIDVSTYYMAKWRELRYGNMNQLCVTLYEDDKLTLSNCAWFGNPHGDNSIKMDFWRINKRWYTPPASDHLMHS